jgi:hypothetical protein
MEAGMKTRTLIALGAVSLGGMTLLSAPLAQARDCCHGRDRCPMMSGQTPGAPESGGGPGMGRTYDLDTVTTLRGTASAMAVVPARGGRMGGTHLTLQSDGQTMDVHLGPTWFLQREGVEVAKGDSIEVTGSVIDSDGNSFLIARELKKGQKVLKLRDEQGVPVWSAGRRP